MTQISSQSRHMTAICREKMMEIQYFMARDFSLDPKLYSACREDAEKICQIDTQHWYSNRDPNDHQLVLACLSRNLYGLENEDTENELDENDDNLISDQCADEVERVLEERAISVHLHPEIDDACRVELTNFCVSETQDGAEFKCLQENIDNLGKLFNKGFFGYFLHPNWSNIRAALCLLRRYFATFVAFSLIFTD